ncbi:MAG: glycosyltransferase family 9 protein [Vicinamibacterales bacterium]
MSAIPARILLIRLRLIGDVVFTTPLLGALKRAFPAAHLTYVVERAAAPVVAAHPHIDELIVIDKSRGWQRLREDVRLALRLRRAHFDLVLDLHGGPRSAWLTLATAAPTRIGYDIQGRRGFYTRQVHRPRGLHARHSVLNQWDLLEAIDGWPGIPADPARDAVSMAPDPAAEASAAATLAAAGVSPGSTVIVVHVSAGNPFRRWPEPAFITLVTGLAGAAPDRRLVLSSGPSDRAAADRIASAARQRLGPGAAGRIVDCGELNLAELRAVIARSQLFVGGDTGPLHVAATTRTAVVGIYGPTLEARSAPWRDRRIPTAAVYVDNLPCRPCDQRVCAPGDFRCLTTLPPETVLEAAERLLAQNVP